MDVPSNLLPGDLDDYVRGKTNVAVTMTPQMKALVIEGLHKEGFTTSVSQYVRVILANHLAELLEMSVTEVMRGQPRQGSRKGERFRRVG
jgi:hypothetical protein